MTRVVAIIVLYIALTGSLGAQSGFFRSYNHAPWFSDGARLALYNDSLIIGQSVAVDTTGNYGFTLAAYHLSTGEVVDSFTYMVYRESTTCRALATDGYCVGVGAIHLVREEAYPVLHLLWVPNQGIVDTLGISRVDSSAFNTRFDGFDGGMMVYQPYFYKEPRQSDQFYNGVARRYSACGDLTAADTLFRDTLGSLRIHAHYADASRYLMDLQAEDELRVIRMVDGEGVVVHTLPYESDAGYYSVHFDDLLVTEKYFVSSINGARAFMYRLTVYDDELNLLWRHPFIPMQLDPRPSYFSEWRAIHVGEDYITVVGTEDLDADIPNFRNRVNRLYSTRYTLEGDLVWHRKYAVLDGLLANIHLRDIELDHEGSIYAYGFYTHRTPVDCDTCAITRNTFLMKLDPEGYLDGRPTSTVDQQDGPALTIYPNPATDRLAILSDGLITQVTIQRLDGVEVYSSPAMGDVHHVDVSPLSRGLYLVTVRDDLGRLTTEKVVIM